MPDGPVIDPVLARFRAELGAMYGANLERAILFGSRARGDARADSDYDVAVFLKSLPDRWKEADRLADLGLRLFEETDAWMHAMPYPASAYDERTPLMHEVRREGREL